MEKENISAEKYSLLQLKAWCTAVGLNASGAKASLAARLSELSAEARGSCPAEVLLAGAALQGKDLLHQPVVKMTKTAVKVATMITE